MDLTTILVEVATLLLDLRTLLLDLRTLLLDLALPQTTPPLDRFSKLRLDRNSSDSRGLELRYHATWQEAFQYTVWFSASFPFYPLLNSYLVSTWVKVPHVGAFISLQYLNFPPLCPSSNFLHVLHSVGFNIYTSP